MSKAFDEIRQALEEAIARTRGEETGVKAGHVARVDVAESVRASACPRRSLPTCSASRGERSRAGSSTAGSRTDPRRSSCG